MCGISFILSGVQIDSSIPNLATGFRETGFGSSLREKASVSGTVYPTIDDLKEVISRRGPDRVGHERVHLKVVTTHEREYKEGNGPLEGGENFLDGISYGNSAKDEKYNSFAQISCGSQIRSAYSEMTKMESIFQEHINKHSDCVCNMLQAAKNHIVANVAEDVNERSTDAIHESVSADLQFLGATLQLRGVHPVFQPLRDSSSNVLVYNGEVFGGISVGKEENDTKALMDALQRCCSCPCHANARDCCCSNQEDHISVPELLSAVKGPWAFIYWQAKSKVVWFGRDAFGRRSLLVHWPSSDDSRLLLSSVAPFHSLKKSGHGRNEVRGAQCLNLCDYTEEKETDSMDDLEYWDELACGIYSISLETSENFGCNGNNFSLILYGNMEKHDWSNPLLKKLLKWERCFVVPESNGGATSKFMGSQIGISTSFSKENYLTLHHGDRMDAKLDYHEFCETKKAKSRMATEDNQELENGICRDDSSLSTNDKGPQFGTMQLSECMDCISLNSVMLQNNVKMQCPLGSANSGALCLSGKSSLKTVHSNNMSTKATSSLELESEIDHGSETCSAQHVLNALKQAVMRRTCQSRINLIMEAGKTTGKYVPIAILFSGGLDSMILAALLDQCLSLNCEIDLLNVSFDGASAPDRISAKAGVRELRRIAPLRRWNLVEIDADPKNLHAETKHLTSIIYPTKTYMDLNIGTALWLAACGDGWVEEDGYSSVDSDSLSDRQKLLKRREYKSEARILLVGSGADEQCAGYGRHRTKFRQGGWVALEEEMKIDVQRIWKRNLGRDDRCIADHGKEARFPFLDEDVIDTLLDLPLWEIANLKEPAGQGDKKILRQVARLLGLEEASTIPKRAIQFGSRIARESNRRNFGSNRAANQASAGSAVIHCLRE